MIPWGWIGNALLITGAWRIGKKHRHAFAFTLCGGLCWLYEATKMGRADWVFIEVVMFAVACRNYWYWLRDGKHPDVPERTDQH